MGSRFTVDRAIALFSEAISARFQKKSLSFPSQQEWVHVARQNLLKIRKELVEFAFGHQIELRDLACTLIVVVFSPNGLLVTHIGDGRAGYKAAKGIWSPMIVPHKGQEANETIFVTTNWHEDEYVLSDVSVPESNAVEIDPKAFVLMTDGCQMHSYQCNYRNSETGLLYDPNKPHSQFFDPVIDNLKKMKNAGWSEVDMEKKWEEFLERGNGFVDEEDDKAMVIGLNTNYPH
jgi:hypothetical protein